MKRLLGWIPSFVSEADAAEPAPSGAPLRYAFMVNWDDASAVSLRAHLDAIDVLVPEWLHLNEDGTVDVDDPDKVSETVETLGGSERKMPVMPLINNIIDGTWEGAATGRLLADGVIRKKLVDDLLGYVGQHSFEGITIDFEAIPPSAMPAMETFVSDLSTAFHRAGLKVNIAVPLYGAQWHLQTLSRSVDTIFLMAYDQHGAQGAPGPIAAQEWFETGLARRIDEAGSAKLVLAVGNYGYDWREGASQAEVHTVSDVYARAEQAGAVVHLDGYARNPSFQYDDVDNEHRTVWFLDAVTSFNEIKYAERFNLKGVALWRLGAEDPSFWSIFRNIADLTKVDLTRIDSDYAINYVGTGEVLRVVGQPTSGHRALVRAPDDMIADEAVSTFPHSYNIARWGGKPGKELVLTFDDGPDEVYTPQILDILKRYKVPGAFFVVGSNANRYPDIVRRIVEEGHEIGNHTFTHPDIAHVSTTQQTMEINATQRVIESITGRSTVLFRPPFAVDIEPQSVEEIKAVENIGKMGYLTVNMYIDGNDWKPGSTAPVIIDRVVNDLETNRGHIILLHDAGGDRSATVAALPTIIEKLRAKGYEFVSVAKLLGLPESEVMPIAPRSDLLELDALGYGTMRFVQAAIGFMFVGTIALGLSRSGLIGFLALRRRKRRMIETKRLIGDRGSMPPDLKIGVVVPAYNEEKVIAKTVDSLLASTGAPFAILVVDDGSTDGTVAVVRERYADEPRVSLMTKPNGGKAEALNLAFASTDCDVIVALDADTVFLPDTVSNLVRNFDDPQIAAVAGNAKVGNRINLLTRWQALEYIIAQNLDRRAFERLNCITVVPGAVGAWRREAVLAVGGFGTDTLAEDADLTLRLIRAGHRVVYEEDAIALTEAPADIRSFVKQRFRWMYGMLQTAYKHRDAMFGSRLNSVGLVALPNILIFQLLFPCIAPIADLYLIASIVGIGVQTYFHPAMPVGDDVIQVFLFYALFIVVDYLVGILAFCNERRENWALLYLLVLQRVVYRQLLYYVAIKTILVAIRGRAVGWFKLERLASVASAPLPPDANRGAEIFPLVTVEPLVTREARRPLYLVK